MGHKYLTMSNFGPRIAFIGGKNWSGKSSCVNALANVLGGKLTCKPGKRANWIREWNGEKAKKAVIKLTINNSRDCPKPHENEKYGDALVIELVVKLKNSTYYLSGKDGKNRTKITSEQLKDRFLISPSLKLFKKMTTCF